MAEVGETIQNDNLFPEDTSEWTEVNVSGVSPNKAYRIGPLIDVRDLTIDGMHDYSLRIKLANIESIDSYGRSRAVTFGIGFYLDGNTEKTLNINGGGNQSISTPTEGPIELTISNVDMGINDHRVTHIAVVYGVSGIRITNTSFEYSKVMLTQGDPQPWTGGGTNEGIVDITNRFSPRIAANNFGIYPLSRQALANFSKDIWSRSFIEMWSEFLLNRDPLSNILSLKYYYGISGNIPRTESNAYVCLGNTIFNGVLTEHAVVTKPATSEYVEFDAGEIPVTRKFNNFLDYAPHTQVEIYVPFYGFHQLNTNEVMGNRIRLIYTINIGTGIATANIYLRAPDGARYRLITQLSCAMGVQIPFSVEQQDTMMNMLTRQAGKVAAVTGGAALATTIPAMATGAVMGGGGIASKLTGGEAGAMRRRGLDAGMISNMDDKSFLKEIDAMNSEAIRQEQTFMGGLANGVQVPQISTQPSSRSAGMDAETGSMSDFTPALYVARPESLAPANYNDFVGTPDFTSGRVGDFDSSTMNYLKAGAISDGNYRMPQKAQDEIFRMLRGGVYID